MRSRQSRSSAMWPSRTSLMFTSAATWTTPTVRTASDSLRKDEAYGAGAHGGMLGGPRLASLMPRQGTFALLRRVQPPLGGVLAFDVPCRHAFGLWPCRIGGCFPAHDGQRSLTGTSFAGRRTPLLMSTHETGAIHRWGEGKPVRQPRPAPRCGAVEAGRPRRRAGAATDGAVGDEPVGSGQAPGQRRVRVVL